MLRLRRGLDGGMQVVSGVGIFSRLCWSVGCPAFIVS